MLSTVNFQAISEMAQTHEHSSPEQILHFATTSFPKIILACSFGPEDIVLVDLLHKVNPNVDMFFLDTGFHFLETYEVRDTLAAKYNKTFIQVKSNLTPEQQAHQYGDHLWQEDPNTCCAIRKVEPLYEILRSYDAWITGIRRDQAITRAQSIVMEWDRKFNLVKFNPLVRWTSTDVWTYIREHQLPYNSLHDQNYPSIGCTHCTRPVVPGEDPRSGRWAGMEKTECGLHK
jgi:phosphoadenosine phosphosulfate reductase